MVEALIRPMNAPGPRVGPVNLGNPVEHSILEIAEIVKERAGAASSVVMMDLPADDPKSRRPDIAKAERELGWRPSTPLLEGLDRTIKWVREALRETPAQPDLNQIAANHSEGSANPFRKSDDRTPDRRAVTGS
jgi:UDP-glucuronate decarboxylase